MLSRRALLSLSPSRVNVLRRIRPFSSTARLLGDPQDSDDEDRTGIKGGTQWSWWVNHCHYNWNLALPCYIGWFHVMCICTCICRSNCLQDSIWSFTSPWYVIVLIIVMLCTCTYSTTVDVFQVHCMYYILTSLKVLVYSRLYYYIMWSLKKIAQMNHYREEVLLVSVWRE